MHAHDHTATLTEWTLAAGSAEGMPNLQVKKARENSIKSECFQSSICEIVYPESREY